MSTVTCRNLTKSFDDQPVVQDVSLSVAPGEILVLLGPSGCGKTTTLRLIAGFEKLDDGRIEINHQLMADGATHVPPEKRRVGIVFQDYAIFPHLSLAQNVGFGLKRGQSERVAEMLNFVGLGGLGERMPHQLSGGQQQRVAIARALMQEPSLMLADEPVASLDPVLAHSILQYLELLNRQDGITVICSLHFLDLVHRYATRVIGLKAGELVFDGIPGELTRERFKEVYGEEAEMVTVGGQAVN